jgi:tyrosyl-tRNA synthetase
MGQSPQQVLLVPLLIGTDGKQKMSKSLGNHIGITEPPEEMYGKIMSLPDSLIMDYLELVTDVPGEEIAEFRAQLETQSINPVVIKKRLAYEIVRQFHGKQAAAKAEKYFAEVFQKKETPEEVPEYTFAASCMRNGLYRLDIAPTLLQNGLIKSNSELKRLLAQGAIELDGNKVSTNIIEAHNGSILKIGKHRFIRIAIK